MAKAIVFHHDDPDGRMGGFIMKKYFENQQLETGTYECSYSSNEKGVPFDRLLERGDKVAIVDFSFNNRNFEALLSCVDREDVIWIDHHKSAMEACTVAKGLQGIRKNGLAGCELAWMYYEGYRQRDDSLVAKINASNSDVELSTFKQVEIPRGIHLIGDYDCWRKEFPESNYLIMGIESIWTSLELNNPSSTEIWDKIFNSDEETISKFISDGECIKRYVDAQNAVKCKKAGFEVRLKKFNQYKAIAINSDTPNSWIFDTVFAQYHIGIVFRYSEKNNKSDMSFSIYRLGLDPNTEIDCSKIAMSYGGGGHAGASGFSTSGTLPFER